jgi:hypothetical protein
MKGVFEVTCETTRTKIDDTKAQGVRLVRVRDTPVVLGHNERTIDEHGKTCVQEGLTLR